MKKQSWAQNIMARGHKSQGRVSQAGVVARANKMAVIPRLDGIACRAGGGRMSGL